MKNIIKAIKEFWKDESGVTAIEYGLIAIDCRIFKRKN